MTSTMLHRKKGTPRPPPAPLKTSDYSSDEELATSKSESREAYEVYKKSGDWWNVFPKTDYTYSRISPHRKTLPGIPGMVVIPNMSRRSLHGELSMSSLSDASVLTSTKIRNEMMHSPTPPLTYSQYSESYNSPYQPQSKPSTAYQTAATSQSQNGMFSKMKEYYSKMSSYSREEDYNYDSDFDEVDMAATKLSHASNSSDAHSSMWWTFWLLITTTITTVTTTVTNSVKNTVSAVAGRTAHALSFQWMGRLLEWLYWLVANVLVLDTWLLMSQHHVRSPSVVTGSQKRLGHLLLLLAPILLLFGWWACSSNSDHSLSSSSLLSLAETFSPVPLLSNLTRVAGSVISTVAQFFYYAGSGLVSLFWWLIPFVGRETSSGAVFVSQQSESSFTAGLGAVPPCQMNVELLAKQILESGPFQEFAVRVAAYEKLQEFVPKETVTNVKSSSDTRASDVLTVAQVEQLKEVFKSEVSSKADDQYRLMMAKLGQTAYGQRGQSAILSRLATELQSLREQMNLLSAAVVEQQAGGQNTSESLTLLNAQVAGLQGQLKDLQDQQRMFAASFKDCCQNSSALMRATIEEHVTAFLSQALGAPPPSGKESGKRAGVNKDANITAWIRSYFVAHDILEARLASLAQDIKRETSDGMVMTMHQSTETIMTEVSKRIQDEFMQHTSSRLSAAAATNARGSSASVSASLGLSDSEVRKIVQEVLTVYDADKTGRVDYALESSGGSIVSTRCTDTYHAQSAVVSLFGIPLWYPSNNPRTVIQPGVQPGECWAFKGSQGYVVIQLSGYVRISAFSMEHIPRSLSPSGNIDSAPRDFKVLGLSKENDKEPVELGQYTYNQNDTALQYFIVQEPDPQPFNLIELQILSNHGHMEYTCLYRFRVHGVLMK